MSLSTGAIKMYNGDADPENFAYQLRGNVVIYNYKDFLKILREEFLDRLGKPIRRNSLDNFETMHAIGQGAFGRVLVCKDKCDKRLLAMKTLKKSMVVKKKQVAQTLNELRIGMAFRYPFVMSFDYLCKDNSYLYIIMPFMAGGDMFGLLRKMGKFPEAHARFYACQVVLALEYLHYLGMAYRDLKPENILIDLTGYIKVTDFGFTKVVSERTYTMCGTPEYIAPEIILGQGYGTAVDWWSCGVLLYEMCAGRPPFVAKDELKQYDKICAGKFKMPPHFTDDLQELLTNLIQVDLTKRYGNMRKGVNDIKDHRWFRYVDWMALLNRKIEPPFKPKIKSAEDTSNFPPMEDIPLDIADTEEYVKQFADF